MRDEIEVIDHTEIVNGQEKQITKKIHTRWDWFKANSARSDILTQVDDAFRQIEKDNGMPVGYDFLFIARSTIIDSKCADVKKSIEAAVKRAGLTA